MLLPILVLSLAQIPNGAYGMPELCEKLKAATGVAYSVGADLRDFPVFISTKTGDPERVKQLVADALRAKWEKDGDRIRLVAVKEAPDADYPEFERQYKAACAGKASLLGLPAKDAFRMAPGEILRYGNPPDAFHKPFPKEVAKKLPSELPATVAIHRMAEGVFECKINMPGETSSIFDPGGTVEFRSLPKQVEDALKDDLAKQVLTPTEQRAIQKMATNPTAMNVDWTDLNKRDPIAAIAQQILPSTAKAVQLDMALALPDMSLFVLGISGGGGNTVSAILTPFSKVVDLTITDGALIGKIPSCDRFGPAQVKRDVLARFLSLTAARGVANADILSEYVRNQRPAASNSWADAMLLILAGTVVDQSYIGDYPYNLRLYTQLDKNDWNLVRSGQPFLASQLSLGARRELGDVLLQSRNHMETRTSDPSLWGSLEADNLSIKAELSYEQVLIGWTGFSAEVESVSSSASMHDMREKSLGHEPLYQVATRQKLKLTISSIADEKNVETGFTIVVPDDKNKPTTWDKLPADITKAFKKSLDQFRVRPPDGVPPPVAVKTK